MLVPRKQRREPATHLCLKWIIRRMGNHSGAFPWGQEVSQQHYVHEFHFIFLITCGVGSIISLTFQKRKWKQKVAWQLGQGHRPLERLSGSECTPAGCWRMSRSLPVGTGWWETAWHPWAAGAHRAGESTGEDKAEKRKPHRQWCKGDSLDLGRTKALAPPRPPQINDCE